MNIIYIHGLDSNANSIKGILLEQYCQQYCPDVTVWRPDVNQLPAQVFEQLVTLVTRLQKVSKTVLIGSSLGGYFATLVSNDTSCSALLLNPSMQPHLSLQRFSTGCTLAHMVKYSELYAKVIHTTSGGWAITGADLQWFESHQLRVLKNPNNVAVWIKEGDELLNPAISATFYRQQGAIITMQEGGDHRFSDFDKQLPEVIKTLQQLA